ncbi:hypothetical protein BGZ60DRAFT_454850 [Tricladium varicosporioides]|nr:hypothetical protein BGZ60DRAFT_454850 [Hymenoscyphus varicosporioides]
MIQSYCWIKLSIVFFYRKLLVANKGMFSHFTWALIAIIIAWGVTFTFSIIFSCGTHFHAHWGSRLDLITYCPDGLKRQEGLYVTEFITNVLLIVLPLPTVWSLHTTIKRKFAVTCILLLAFMAFAASIIRLVILLQVVTTPAAYAAKVDENQTITTILYWGMIEAGLALIACSLPMLKPLISEHGIQSAVNSVRSAISLHSITRSNGSAGSKGGSKASKASNNYSKLEPGATDMAPLRGDRAVEGTSSATPSSYHLDEPKPIVEAGKIRIQRDVDVINSRA